MERFLIFIDIPQNSCWEISDYYISFTLFLFPQMYLLILPYSNVVPAPESHRSVASLLSSQSRIPFSGRYSLVKLHGFTPPIFTPQFRAKQKHRKMPTTQAEFLLSEGKPLTVLGQSQWWSIIGSAYANREHKYSIAVFRPVRNYRIYVRKCQEKFCSPLKICCRPIPMPFLPRSSTAALPRSYPRKVVSHFLAGINLSSCTASHHNPRIWKTKSTARH